MSANKHILVFSDWYLPGYRAGGPIRSLANLVEATEFRFSIVTRNTDHHSTTPYPNIHSGKWTNLSERVQVLYLAENEITPARIRNIIASTDADKVYLNSLWSPKFSLIPMWYLSRARMQSKTILAPRGMLKSGALSVKPLKKKLMLRLMRISGIYRDITWEATNEEEAHEVRRHFGTNARIKIGPNITISSAVVYDRPTKRSGELKMACIARISKEKGIYESLLFAKNAGLEGDITIDYYGTWQDEEYLKQCRELANSIQGSKINFKGEIPSHEVPRILSQYHFFYMATLGENYGHAIAEALTQGVPVLISDRTPWKGLKSKKAGWDLPLESFSFAEVLNDLLNMEDTTYQVWSTGALALGKKVTSNSEVLAQAKAVFE
jgi:glycosyltransferase involved in cell wall biosynthesis